VTTRGREPGRKKKKKTHERRATLSKLIAGCTNLNKDVVGLGEVEREKKEKRLGLTGGWEKSKSSP